MRIRYTLYVEYKEKLNELEIQQTKEEIYNSLEKNSKLESASCDIIVDDTAI